MLNDAKTTSTKRLKSLLLMSPDCDRFTSFSSSMKAFKFTRLPTKENAKKKKKKKRKKTRIIGNISIYKQRNVSLQFFF